ncbi:hypothetical protein C8J31_101780 [Rhizobium sp. PP-CC-2G-626]|nr:hypothetical protein C8J31_101780 [Rhizobium sp. PP-CC-2G-626]
MPMGGQYTLDGRAARAKGGLSSNYHDDGAFITCETVLQKT